MNRAGVAVVALGVSKEKENHGLEEGTGPHFPLLSYLPFLPSYCRRERIVLGEPARALRLKGTLETEKCPVWLRFSFAKYKRGEAPLCLISLCVLELD